MRSQIFGIVWKRLLQAIPVLIGVTFFTFCCLNLMPGGTVQAILGFNATPQLVKALSIQLNLNHPFFIRYLEWMWHAVHLNFGTSVYNDLPVTTALKQRIPVSAELGIMAFILALIFALPVAVLVARKPRGPLDRLNLAVSMFGYSCPQFVVAIMAILIIGVHWKILPVLGYVPLSAGVWDNFRHMILPASCIAFGIFCGYTRLLRGDIVDQMNQEDYISTARAKGVPAMLVLIRHALRNSLFGLITVAVLNIGVIVGGSVLIEQIFALPGMGQLIYTSINVRDDPTVQACVTLVACAVVTANLLADILYAVLDPRIRYGRRDS